MSTKVKIKDNSNFYGVFADKDIAKDEVILKLKGRTTNSPSKYSIQTGIDLHLEPLADDPENSESAWRFLNHACEPNCYFNFEDNTFRSSENISKGEELNFNYYTTEFEMAAPFSCNCGSKKCYHEIKGFKYLAKKEQLKLLPLLAPHLQAIMTKEPHLDSI